MTWESSGGWCTPYYRYKPGGMKITEPGTATHYFEAGVTLCGKYSVVMGAERFEADSHRRCIICRKMLERRGGSQAV